MIKFKFIISSDSKVIDKQGVIEQDGFNSFHLVPVSNKGSFDEKFNTAYEIKNTEVMQELASINQEANNIKNQVLDLSTNLVENYLSEASLYDSQQLINLASAIKESTATFVTTEQAGQWYGLELITDSNGVKYATGFDIGAIVHPDSGNSDSYFRINADRFIVGGDLGDGGFSTTLDANGNPIPAFSIVQDGLGVPQMYFNGKVNISSIPIAFNKLIGKFANKVLLDVYLAENPSVVVNDGDTWLNTTQNIVYSWDGDEWISTGDIVKFKSTVFIRNDTKPLTPNGGSYESPLPTSTPTWSDGVPEGNGPIWMSTATIDNKSDYTSVGPAWSEATPLALSENIRFLFSSALVKPGGPGTWINDGDGTYSDSTGNWFNPVTDPMWMAISESKIVNGNVQWSAWVVSKVKGENGTDGDQGPAGTRGTVMARINSTTNNIAYYTTTSGKAALTSAVYAIVTPDTLINGDQVIVTATDGTEIFEYNGSAWGTNTALKVNGNAIIDGTLYANKLAANAISGQTITISSSTNAVGGTTPSGSSSLGYFDTSRDQNAIGAVNRTSGGYAISGISTSTTSSVGVHGRGIYGVLGESTHGSGYWGLITQQKCYSGQGFSSPVTTISFTGGHTCFANTHIRLGDILEVVSGYLMTVDQSYTIVTTATTEKSKRVFGVASKVSDDVEANLRDYAEIHEVGDDISTLGEYKEEYKPFIDNLINNNYKDVTANSIGEGGINVCSINGDIENGDYITSSVVAGKGMKQDDDLLHNHTVAKSLEDVVWDDEVVGENGCFEQDEYKCKMIACTYHSG